MAKILWTDDEIDLLKPLCIILQNAGYEVDTALSGQDALNLLAYNSYEAVLLDENMPGISGLETLSRIKELYPTLPVVMITKSEEENIMEQAIGQKITNYLVKPVSKMQLLSCLKQIIGKETLVNETSQNKYQSEFARLSMEINECRKFSDWAHVYQKLVRWEIDLENIKTMDDIQMMQKKEANEGFCKFIKKNYENWMRNRKSNDEDIPLMSDRIMKERILPILEDGQKVVLIVIDNCRLDQWEILSRYLAQDFNITTELYCSILPTATQFARNAIFSGLMPSEIEHMYPEYWTNSDDENSQNQHEKELIGTFFARYRKTQYKYAYYKVNTTESGEQLVKKYPNYRHNDLNAFVFNFVDMLSHARTDINVVNQLSNTDAAYRSITRSWFEHSALNDLIRILKNDGVRIVITTDHGTIKVTNSQKVVGDREVNTNLRYKTGKNLSYDAKRVLEIKDPEDVFLPKNNLSSNYIFALNDDYFVYPNNHAEYVRRFSDTFQHGGVSMQEMIIPLAILDAK